MVDDDIIQALDVEGEDVRDVVEMVQVLRHQLLQSTAVKVTGDEGGRGRERENTETSAHPHTSYACLFIL